MNTSKFTPITSSNLAGAFHDGEDLYLEFNKGKVYRYLDVPATVFEELLAAESAGRYFHTAIRERFAYELVDLAKKVDKE